MIFFTISRARKQLLFVGLGLLCSAPCFGLGESLLGYFESAVQRAATQATQKFDWTRQLVPFAGFVFNLPNNFIRSLQDNDYQDRKFVIANKTEDEQQDYGIEYDFGFEGSGDINQPFGFVLHDGKFYFKAAQVKFVPEKFYLKNEDGTVREVKRTDIREYPFSVVIPTLLRQFFKEKGLEAWTFVRRLMSPYPEDVAMFRILSLVSSAYFNSTKGEGYPRVAHVPYELSVLFARTEKTPDIRATQQLYPAGTKSNEWELDKIVFLETSFEKLMKDMPEFVQASVRQIQFPAFEGELQEYKDRKGKGITEAQKLYGQMRSIASYPTRTQFVIDKVVPFLDSASGLTQTDANLLMYGVKFHCLERLDGLWYFLLAGTGTATDVTGAVILETGQLDDPSTRQALSKVNGQVLENVLSPQYEALRSMISKARASFVKWPVNSQDMQFLQRQEEGLDAELDRVVVAGDDLAKAILAGSNDDFAAAYKNLESEIDELVTAKHETQNTTATGQRINVPLPEYLNLRYFQFQQLSHKKFAGDVGYYKDDSSLDTIQASMQGMAISMRASGDLMKAENLFKNDTKGQYMTSPSGSRELVVGKLIYQDYHEKPLYYKNKVEEQAVDARARAAQATDSLVAGADQLGLAAQEGAVDDKLKKAEEYFESLNSVFTHYLRQYRFDRRDMSGSAPGKPFDISTLGATVKSKEEILEQDLSRAAKEMIAKYKLYQGSPLVRLDAIIAKRKFEQKLEQLTDKTEALKREGLLAEKRNTLEKYNQDVAQLEEIVGVLQQKIDSSIDAEGNPTPAQQVYKDEQTKVKEAIASRKDDIKTVEEEMAMISESGVVSGQAVASYKDASSRMDTYINNYDLDVPTLDSALEIHEDTFKLKKETESVQIPDAQFLQTALRVRQLVESGESASFVAAPVDQALGGPKFDYEVFRALLESAEKGLGIEAGQSLVGQKLVAAQTKVEMLMDKILIGELDVKGLELEFLQEVGRATGPAVLKNPKSFFAGLARAATFALQHLFASSVGVDLEKYLQEVAIPEARKTIGALYPEEKEEEEPVEASGDSVDALIEQMTQTHSQEEGQAAAVVVDEKFVAGLEAFGAELKTAVDNDSVWTKNLWESSLLVKPSKLPLSPGNRMDVFSSAVGILLLAKRNELGLAPQTVERFYGLYYMASQAYGRAWSDLAGLRGDIETWTSKLRAGAESGDAMDAAALTALKELWGWMDSAVPYVLAYAEHILSVGVRTSINEFLAKEFASLLARAKGFEKIAYLYLDPILIKSLGVDVKTLVEASQEERQLMAQQNLAMYGVQFSSLESLETGVVAGLEAVEKAGYSELDKLAQGVDDMFEGRKYDMTQLEKELAQTAVAANSAGMQFMLSENDFDAYFDKMANEGASYATTRVGIVPVQTGTLLESDPIPGAATTSATPTPSPSTTTTTAPVPSTTTSTAAPTVTPTASASTSPERTSSTVAATPTVSSTTTYVPVAQQR